MSWIRTIDPDRATGKLKDIYARIQSPDGNVDNILKVHSLRPHTLEGHMALYKNVPHHTSNALPKWLLETLGIYVSILNACSYCVDHHSAGLRRLLQNEKREKSILDALHIRQPQNAFSAKETLLFVYAGCLTLHPDQVHAEQIERLRSAGFDDGEILEANQVISYFAYANRTVLGLGVTIQGDTLGLSPSSSETGDLQHR